MTNQQGAPEAPKVRTADYEAGWKDGYKQGAWAAQQPAPSPVPATFLRGVIDLCTQKGFSPENIEAWDSNDKWIADIWRQARELLAAPADSVLEDAARLERDVNAAKNIARFGLESLAVGAPA